MSSFTHSVLATVSFVKMNEVSAYTNINLKLFYLFYL